MAKGNVDRDRFKSSPTGWRRRWPGETVPSRFSRLLALMSQINIHPGGDAHPGGLREDRDNDDDMRDVDRTTDDTFRETIYNKLPRAAISISLSVP